MNKSKRRCKKPVSTRRTEPRQASSTRDAEDQRVRRNLALGLNIAALASLGSLLVFRHRSIEQTGHFRVPVSILFTIGLILLFAVWTLIDWYRHR